MWSPFFVPLVSYNQKEFNSISFGCNDRRDQRFLSNYLHYTCVCMCGCVCDREIEGEEKEEEVLRNALSICGVAGFWGGKRTKLIKRFWRLLRGEETNMLR